MIIAPGDFRSGIDVAILHRFTFFAGWGLDYAVGEYITSNAYIKVGGTRVVAIG